MSGVWPGPPAGQCSVPASLVYMTDWAGGGGCLAPCLLALQTPGWSQARAMSASRYPGPAFSGASTLPVQRHHSTARHGTK